MNPTAGTPPYPLTVTLGQFGTTQGLGMKNLLRSPAITAVLSLCAVAALPAQAMELSDVVTGNELRFLATRPDPQGYWYESRVTLDADSLTTGMVHLHTCHR